MTNEKMLEKTMEVYYNLTNEQKEVCKNIWNNNIYSNSGLFDNIAFTVADLIRCLKSDIADAENKKRGKNEQAKLIKKILKHNARYNPNKERLQNSEILNGCQYCVDGARLCALPEKTDTKRARKTE